MINAITVTNHLDEALRMRLVFPADETGFVVRHIDGLGPCKANINTTNVATNDGSIYNSAHVNSRNILMSMLLRDVSTVEESRLRSYKYFPIKKRIKLRVETEQRDCEIYGYVESNEPDIFSNDPSSVVSVLCPDPYFYSVTKNVTVFNGIEGGFTFPFSNESLTQKLLMFGSIQLDTEKTVIYTGDAPVGITIIIHAIGSATNIRIVNVNTREVMAISSDRLVALTGSDIHAGDTIVISTVKGSKSIILRRDGLDLNIFNTLVRDPDWFQLERGNNLFAYLAESGIENLQFRVENQTAYEGI